MHQDALARSWPSIREIRCGQLFARPACSSTEANVKYTIIAGSVIREIDFICTDHVDDIKVGCREGTFLEFKECFEDVFGKGELEITRANFTSCGIQHKRTDIGYELSQHTYISALKTHPGHRAYRDAT